MNAVIGMPLFEQERDEWRGTALFRVGRSLKAAEDRSLRRMKQMSREQQRAYDARMTRCRASGRYWSKLQNRCR